MRRLIAWLWRKLARVVEAHYGCHLVRVEDWQGVINTAHDLEMFCLRSGFLTTVQHGAGRHAQRKIRRRSFAITNGLRSGASGPWRT